MDPYTDYNQGELLRALLGERIPFGSRPVPHAVYYKSGVTDPWLDHERLKTPTWKYRPRAHLAVQNGNAVIAAHGDEIKSAIGRLIVPNPAAPDDPGPASAARQSPLAQALQEAAVAEIPPNTVPGDLPAGISPLGSSKNLKDAVRQKQIADAEARRASKYIAGNNALGRAMQGQRWGNNAARQMANPGLPGTDPMDEVRSRAEAVIAGGAAPAGPRGDVWGPGGRKYPTGIGAAVQTPAAPGVRSPEEIRARVAELRATKYPHKFASGPMERTSVTGDTPDEVDDKILRLKAMEGKREQNREKKARKTAERWIASADKNRRERGYSLIDALDEAKKSRTTAGAAVAADGYADAVETARAIARRDGHTKNADVYLASQLARLADAEKVKGLSDIEKMKGENTISAEKVRGENTIAAEKARGEAAIKEAGERQRLQQEFLKTPLGAALAFGSQIPGLFDGGTIPPLLQSLIGGALPNTAIPGSQPTRTPVSNPTYSPPPGRPATQPPSSQSPQGPVMDEKTKERDRIARERNRVEELLRSPTAGILDKIDAYKKAKAIGLPISVPNPDPASGPEPGSETFGSALKYWFTPSRHREYGQPEAPNRPIYQW